MKKRIFISVIVALSLFAMAAAASDVSVTRDLPEGPVAAGTEFQVSISQTGFFVAGTVTEVLPEGCTYVDGSAADVDDATYDQDTGTLVLKIDSESSTVTYGVTAGTADGDFTGTYATIDAGANAVLGDVTGDSKVTIIVDTAPPAVTCPTATPDTIAADGVVTSRLDVTVTDDVGVDTVTVNLSQIGGSPDQAMAEYVGGDVYSVVTSASVDTAPGTYHLQVNATDTSGKYNNSISIALTVEEIAYGVDLIAPANRSTVLNANATYGIVVENTGNVVDTFNLSVTNMQDAAVANLSTEQVTINAGGSITVILNVADETVGSYNVSVYAESVSDAMANDTVVIMTTVEKAPVEKKGYRSSSSGAGTYPPGWFATPTPTATVTPTPTPTAAPTDVAEPVVREPVTEEPVTEEPEAEETPLAVEPAVKKPGIPGFLGVFAIAGLLAVAYLIIRRKQE